MMGCDDGVMIWGDDGVKDGSRTRYDRRCGQTWDGMGWDGMGWDGNVFEAY